MSAAGNFSRFDVGQGVWNESFVPFNTPITAVLSAHRALLAAPSQSTGSGLTMFVGAWGHHLDNKLLSTVGSTTIGLAAGRFTRNDVGRMFSLTPTIPDGTTVVSVAADGATATISAPATGSTLGSLAGVAVAPGSTSFTSGAADSADFNGVVGANSLGIPAGTTITSVDQSMGGTLSAPATSGGGPATIALQRPAYGVLFFAAGAPKGDYHVVVVSNGAVDAALDDPGYYQSELTSGAAFTVARY
ncbi:hypothetical protein [Actinoplanes sp. NPDC026619]|uniref:hypothetical protein n=1 Tax=Actinoplanes sp. NPDC026619 TaxID=3155798 RepID=UPI00340063EA